MKNFLEKLNPNERRTVLFCAIVGMVMVGYFGIAEPLLGHVRQTGSQLETARRDLRLLLAKEGSPEALKLKNLTSAVPVLEMPVAGDKQIQLLRDSLTQQVQQCGLQVKNFQFQTGNASGPNANNTMMLQCRGKCQFSSVVRLLEELKKNPYYVGIEELSLRANDQNRQELEFTFTVSTYRGSGATL